MQEPASTTLPNLWSLYNLRVSPFFQDTLGDDDPRHPIALFVGRERERRQLLTHIGGADSSRQAVAGPPGVGKTTLVQSVKASAAAAGYFVSPLVSIQAGGAAEVLIGHVLGALYEALLVARPHTVDAPAMQEAQQVVRAFRLTGGGASVSVAGFGAGASRAASAVTPPHALVIDGPRLIRNLLALVDAAGARGFVLHLNNLENVADGAAREAAEILRGIRDTVLLQHGLHVLVVGTTEAVRTVVTTHAQVREVFAVPVVLDPLPADDVQALLAARYEHLRLDASRTAGVPVEPAAVAGLHELFRGDLRALLKALEDGVTQLLGVTDEPSRPMRAGELLEVLRVRYAAMLDRDLEPERLAQLARWAADDPLAAHTQASLVALWEVTQGTVSTALGDLVAKGYVRALPRERGRAGQYVLAGAARVAFG